METSISMASGDVATPGDPRAGGHRTGAAPRNADDVFGGVFAPCRACAGRWRLATMMVMTVSVLFERDHVG